jgi:hypothetical protein
MINPIIQLDTATAQPVPRWLAESWFARSGIPGTLPPGEYVYVIGCQQAANGYLLAGTWGYYGLVNVSDGRAA